MPDFSIAHCRNCKYELTGLGRSGQCPECGQRFNLNTGWGTLENKDDPADRMILFHKIKIIALFSVAGLVFVLSVAFMIIGWWMLARIGVLVMVLLVLGGVTSWADYRNQRTHEQRMLAIKETMSKVRKAPRKDFVAERPGEKDDLKSE